MAAATAVFRLHSIADGATDTWTGNTSANWNVVDGFNAVPSSGDLLLFNAAGSAGATLNDNLTSSSFNIAGITFSNLASAYTIGGNAFNLTGAVNNSSANLETINDAISATAVQTFTLTTGGGNITLGGIFSGTGGGITTAGAGILTLGGNNSYTGVTTIGSGTTIKSGNAAALGSATTAFTISGGTLDLGGYTITKGTLTASAASSTITSTSAGTLVVSGGSNLSGLSVSGAASLIVNGGNSLTTAAATLVTGTGALGFQNQTGQIRDNNLQTNLGTSGSLLFNGTGLFQTTSGQTLGSGNGLVVNGTGNLWNFQSTLNINGAVTGSGILALNQGSSPTCTLGGNVTGFTGTLDFQTAGTTSNNSATLTFSDSTAGQIGAASAVIDQQVLVTGNTGANTLQWGGTGATVTIPLGDLNTAGTTAGSGTIQLRNNVANSTATFQVGALNKTSTYAGRITNGTGTAEATAIDKVGTGIWTLSGTSNNYTGATTVDNGTLLVSGAYNGTGTAATVNSGGILKVNGSLGGTAAVTVSGGGALAGAGGTVAGPVTIAGGGSAASQGSVNLSGDGAENTLTLSSGLTVGGASASNPSILAFDITSGNNSDVLVIGGTNGFVVNAGGAFVNPVPTSVTNGETFTLATYSDTTAPTGVTFSNGQLTQTSGFLTETLSVGSTALTLSVTTTAFPTTAYFTGAYGSNFTDSNGANANFTTDAAGTTNTGQIPGSTTDVFLVANTDSQTTIGLGNANFEIKGLTFTGTGTAGTAPITLNNGTGGGNTLQIDGDGLTVQSGSGGGTIAVTTLLLGANETWANNSANTFTVNSAIGNGAGGPYALTFAGSGTFVLNGANSYGGGTTLSGGTLQLGNASALGSTTAALAINGGTLDVNGQSIAIGTLTGGGAITNTSATAAATLTLNSGGTFSGNISNGASQSVAITLPSGMLVLSGSNSYSGATTVAAGTLQLQANPANTAGGISSAMGSASTLALSSGATVQLRGDSNATFSSAGISAGAAATLNFDVNQLTGAGSNQTLGINGPITYTGGATDAINVTGGNGYTLSLGAISGVGNGTSFTLNPTTANLIVASITPTGNSSNIFLSGSGNTTVTGFITNAPGKANAVILNGTGVVTLIGSNTYTGVTTINSGATLQLGDGTTGHDGTISTSSVSNSGTLIYDRFGSATAGYAIGGGGTVTISGTGTQTFTATNGYAGPTMIGAGATLQLGDGTAGHDGTITSSSNIVDNGTLIYNRFSATPTLYGNAITGSGHLVKTGVGAQTLSGANSYLGTTVVNGGTLSVTGTHTGGGAYTVGDGTHAAFLAGTGTISNSAGISVSANATLAPGLNGETSNGTLSTGGVTLNDNATFAVSVNSTPATPTADELVSTGTVSLGTGGDSLALLSITSDLGNTTLALGATIPIIVTPAAPGAGGGVFGTFSNGAGPITVGSNAYSVVYQDPGSSGQSTEVSLDVVSTPEPTSAMLIGIGGGGFLLRRRRRQRARV